MTSKQNSKEAYVWIWLPGETESVFAGKLEVDNGIIQFNYGKSYLQRPNSIPIYEPELPLQPGVLPLPGDLEIPNCIRDAAPDAWGRRVIINRQLGKKERDTDTAELDELIYLLESGSDRIGALDFQRSSSGYVPRSCNNASLEELLESADRVEKGVLLTPELDQALYHGSSIGGARPKDVLLIRRFDRIHVVSGWQRKSMVSALTLFGLSDMTARYASYEELAQIIRARFTKPKQTLHELYGRLVFNVLCGNTDDHARNHAAFWDGSELTLTPAYDICPQNRAGN